MQVVEQRRKLPPVLNDKALFTRAAPFGDRADQAYHAPSNRIGAYYSPAARVAAAALFEEHPQAGGLVVRRTMSHCGQGLDCAEVLAGYLAVCAFGMFVLQQH